MTHTRKRVDVKLTLSLQNNKSMPPSYCRQNWYDASESKTFVFCSNSHLINTS